MGIHFLWHSSVDVLVLFYKLVEGRHFIVKPDALVKTDLSIDGSSGKQCYQYECSPCETQKLCFCFLFEDLLKVVIVVIITGMIAINNHH